MQIWLDEKHNPVHRTPIALITIVVLNVAVFGYTFHYTDINAVYQEFGFVPANPSAFTLISSSLLHGGYAHLIGNMFFLWIFGDNVEDALGSAGFALSYLICALAAPLPHYLANMGSDVPMVGASGAISGILGIYLCFYRHSHIDLQIYLRHNLLKTFHLSGFFAIGAWAGYQLLQGIAALAFSEGSFLGVAVWAHVGGFVAGILCGVTALQLGMKAPAPQETLKLERYYLAPVWCPHCGKAEEGEQFGLYQCDQCGVSYEIIDALRENADLVSSSWADFEGWGLSSGEKQFAFVYFKREHTGLAVQIRYKVMASLPSDCLTEGILRQPGPPHPAPMFKITYLEANAGAVIEALRSSRSGLSVFFSNTESPTSEQLRDRTRWLGHPLTPSD